jgi:hypothetical protein
MNPNSERDAMSAESVAREQREVLYRNDRISDLQAQWADTHATYSKSRQDGDLESRALAIEQMAMTRSIWLAHIALIAEIPRQDRINDNIVPMKQPDYNATFKELTSGLIVPQDISDEFEQKSAPTLVSIDHIKTTLLEHLTDQLVLTAGEDMSTSAPDIDEKLYTLSCNLQRDVEHTEGLVSGDIIAASGDAIIILADDTDGSIGAVGISDTIQIRGTFECVVATHIPAHHTIPDIQQIENDMYNADDNPLPMTLTPGITLYIKDATLVDNDEIMPIDEKFTVLIPLNYPKLRLMKEVTK